MSKKCDIKGCDASNKANIFTISTTENSNWFKYIDKRKVRNENNLFSICRLHFEDKFINKHRDNSPVTLKKNAIPTLHLLKFEAGLSTSDDSKYRHEESDQSQNTIVKKKRGSSGLANLQKARMRKLLRRERMKSLKEARRANKKFHVGNNDVKKENIKQSTEDNKHLRSEDYFLGNREITPAEKLIVPLRSHELLKRLHDGSKLCKIPPASIRDQTKFPIFNKIRQMENLNADINPIHWSINEANIFISTIASKAIANNFLCEEIDGEAIINLTLRDLTEVFQIEKFTADSLISVFSQLRKEIIQRYVNI
ncbi:CLUMA_CG016749, isoform A [Clunio marinus]|uniref:CLUMA_CG016749, isoform A n=1 Tax=Clunio marinus TaxID=568069 RepID=A0A1J1ISY0_9DIPT|nr:CLUMA_CG016749, isoform A [Clunio marinus]